METQKIQVTSVQPQCLDNLRFPKKEGRIQLLPYMSQFIEDSNVLTVEEVDEFCCYDRMKKLLQKDKQPINQYQNRLSKAIHIEAKMNNMEKEMNKLTQQKQVKLDKVVRGRSSYNLARKQIVDNIKKKGFEKLINMYKSSKDVNFGEFKIQMEKEIQNKVTKMLDERDSTFMKLVKENKQLKKDNLIKQLTIQQLKTEIIFLHQHKQPNISIEVLQEIKSKQSTIHNQWEESFKECFPNMTIQDVKNKVDMLVDNCLMKLKYMNEKSEVQWSVEKKNYQKNINNLKNQIKTVEGKLVQSLAKYSQLEQFQNISTIETENLIKCKANLQKLQNKILSMYNEWYGQRSQNQKQMLKYLGHLKQDYDYQEMLKYIVQYKNKFSTDHKLNEYIIKILRGVQKLRRIIYPKQANTKLEPFKVLQKLQSWVKHKVAQDFGKTNLKKIKLNKKKLN